MKENYERWMNREIQRFQARGEVPRLLLHSCCAPCSSAVLESVFRYFEITVFYYNPNIFPKEEYLHRVQEQKRFLAQFPSASSVTFLEGDYQPERFFQLAQGLEQEPEGGERCARCYEHIFLFSKSKKYFFDYKAISEPIAPATAERLKRGMKGGNKYGKPVPGQPQPQSINRPREHGEIKDADINPLRNKRDVWKINTVPFKGGHYAAYPPKLVETCLLAGCPEGGIVLDPFMGSGTTGMVASQMGRHFVGIELNPEYTELAYKRIGGEI